MRLIAMAEDDADVREMATLWLQREGFTVHCSEDGQQLVDAVRDGLSPRAFVLDFNMPCLNGIETWRSLRSSAVANIPAFLWTACTKVNAPDGLIVIAKVDNQRLLSLLHAC